MNEDQLQKMKATMAGATKDYKAKLQSQVDAATYGDIRRAASRIINTLPAGVPLGTMTAALMLAALSYAEAAAHADRLINDDAPESKAP